MKILGILLIIWGIADFALSWTGTDLYAAIGISIPEAIYQFTPMIAGVIGYALLMAGSGKTEE